MEWAEGPGPEARLAAVRLADSAVRRDPGNPALHLALGGALDKIGEVERAAEVTGAASVRFSNSEPLKAALAGLLGRLGQTDRALAAAQALADPARKASLSLALLAQAGRFEEAERFEPEAAARDPFDPMLVECRMRRLRSDPGAMLALCSGLLERRPADARALYHKAIALAQLDRAEEAVSLMALDRLVADFRIEAPDGWSSGSEFRAILGEEIGGAPDLRADPAGHATVDGLRTRTFPRAGDRASAALVQVLRDRVQSYAAGLDGDHPFVRERPGRASLNAWGLIFPSAGRQRVHCHPDRWATGVFYAAAPNVAGDGGSIRIGILPDWAQVDPPWPVLVVRPEPGRLLVFPSFVPHDTIPTGAEGHRIAVAFDVTPAG